jgi:ATP-binding cassette, subfamily C (CFTR/MRP), member 1
MDEYGALEREEDGEAKLEAVRDEKAVHGETDARAPEKDAVQAEKKAQTALMQAEERNKGSVSSETYVKYLKHAGRQVEHLD